MKVMSDDTVGRFVQMLSNVSVAYQDAHKATLDDPAVPEPILIALDGAVGAFTRLTKTCGVYIEGGRLIEGGPEGLEEDDG